MAAAVLVTLVEAKAHLRITLPPGDPGDADLQAKLDESEALIRKYLKQQDDASWTAATAPAPVRAAIKLYLARLYEHRGDRDDDDEATWAAITRLLSLYRDPGLA